MRSLPILLIFFVLWSVSKVIPVHGDTITEHKEESPSVIYRGEGLGETQKESEKEALSDLSTSLELLIKGKIRTNEIEKLPVLLSGKIPIVGVVLETQAEQGLFHTIAVLEAKKVLILYESRLKEFENRIKQDWKLFSSETNNHHQQTILNRILVHLQQLYNYHSVASILGSQKKIQLPVTKLIVQRELDKLLEEVQSMEEAATRIATAVKQKNVYVHPPTTKLSNEITPFASVISEKISSVLQSVTDLKKASFHLIGDYQVSKAGIRLTYSLLDLNSDVQVASSIKLLPVGYEKYEVEPKNYTFDNILNGTSGLVVSQGLKVNLRTNKGHKNLIFHGNEVLEILLKMNRPGYFYVVGHTKNTKSQQSYLLQLSRGVDRQKFVVEIDTLQVNKWVLLGQFEVLPPFGMENFQVIACTEDYLTLPQYEFDPESGYYIISDDPSLAVKEVRKNKATLNKNTEVKCAEAVLTYTTHEK